MLPGDLGRRDGRRGAVTVEAEDGGIEAAPERDRAGGGVLGIEPEAGDGARSAVARTRR
jgi:hypothetical protein